MSDIQNPMVIDKNTLGSYYDSYFESNFKELDAHEAIIKNIPVNFNKIFTGTKKAIFLGYEIDNLALKIDTSNKIVSIKFELHDFDEKIFSKLEEAYGKPTSARLNNELYDTYKKENDEIRMKDLSVDKFSSVMWTYDQLKKHHLYLTNLSTNPNLTTKKNTLWIRFGINKNALIPLKDN